jgi:hypothetical protein
MKASDHSELGVAQGEAQTLTPHRVTRARSVADQGDALVVWEIHPIRGRTRDAAIRPNGSNYLTGNVRIADS